LTSTVSSAPVSVAIACSSEKLGCRYETSLTEATVPVPKPDHSTNGTPSTLVIDEPNFSIVPVFSAPPTSAQAVPFHSLTNSCPFWPRIVCVNDINGDRLRR
jgi:hypothetical protein